MILSQYSLQNDDYYHFKLHNPGETAESVSLVLKLLHFFLFF